MGDVLGGRRRPAHVVGEAVDTLAVAAIDLDERLFLALCGRIEELLVRALEPGRRRRVVSSAARVESVTTVVTPWSRKVTRIELRLDGVEGLGSAVARPQGLRD